MTDIVIYGRGKTGQSLYKMLSRQGQNAYFYDDIDGFDVEKDFNDKTLVLLSPGVKPNAEGVKRARKAGARLESELEYCFKYCAGKCVSVTGTNGKTTTCEMIYHILKNANVKCRLLGNGGVPFAEQALDVLKDEVVVLESSSFQLVNVRSFSPYISVFTSLARDHLDYHETYEEYVTAKTNNFALQEKGYALFNADDCNVVEVSKRCRCKRMYYSTCDQNADCYFDGESVVVNIDGKRYASEGVFLKRYAKHNLSNALASLLTACLLGIDLSLAIKLLAGYKFLPHRIEEIAILDGVRFVDDSKATNVHATVTALQSFTCPLALILGGSDKGECFDDIFLNLPDNVVVVTASGATATRIADCANKYGVKVKVFDDIREATVCCFDILKACGGVVLMSNACASFDKFGGYAERGEYFRKAVEELAHGKKTN